MKLAAVGALAALYTASADNGISVACNADNTLEVTINYDQEAEILELNYGSCDLDSSRIEAEQDDSDFSFAFNISVTDCEMDSTLRTLTYNQTMDIRIGRKTDDDTELTLADFTVDTSCEYTTRYTVTFDYGTISSEAHSFDTSGGLIDLEFSIQSYNSDFSALETAPTTGGEMIYLGMTIDNENFDFADNFKTSSEGKSFVVESCTVSDTDNTIDFTLWDTTDDTCSNEYVNLSVACKNCEGEGGTPMWTISHTLFLLGDHKSSTFQLSCDVLVCDMAQNTDCLDALTVCSD